MAVKLTDSVVSEKLKKLGYTKTVPYINSLAPLVVKDDISGNLFTTTWNRIQQGHRPGRKRRSAKKYSQSIVKDIFKKEGYTLLSTYENSSTNNTLLAPSGELWHCSLSHFRAGRRCKDFIGISQGELAIKTILQESGINFYRQYYVNIKGNKHLFDFYLPDSNIFIEYDGEQHYRPVHHYGGKESYKRQKEKDQLKDGYCQEHGKLIIRVPFTVIGVNDIYEYLNGYIDEKLIRPTHIDSTSYKEIASYYLYHSIDDTCTRFTISKSLVSTSFLDSYGMSKQKYIRASKYKEPAEEFLNGKSQKYIADKYGVNALYAFKTIYGMSKNEYVKENVYPLAALDYLSGKSRKYIQEKYRVNAQVAFRYVYKDNIRNYRRKNKCPER